MADAEAALQVGFGRRRRARSDAPESIAATSLSSESARELADLRTLEPRLDDTTTLEAHPEHDPNDRQRYERYQMVGKN